jgi:hypothetical protein
MNFLNRWFQRLIIAIISLGVLWFIVTQIFERLDERLPLFFALFLTYYISAYVFLPQIIGLTLLLLRRGRIPRFTKARDGFLVDPVNIILMGSQDQLQEAFRKMGWYKADRITINSCIKMGWAFILNRPYNKAPFSRLFLFGRKQDIGFQEAIGNSPRKRHHIRFWATTNKTIDPLDVKYWTKRQRINRAKATTWVGAGSEDIGFSFTKLTYQVTHKVDPNVDRERDYILKSLKKADCIEKIDFYKPGTFKVGKYTSDGRIAVAKLK